MIVAEAGGLEAPSCELTNATIEKHLQRLSSCRCFFLCWDFYEHDDIIFEGDRVRIPDRQVH